MCDFRLCVINLWNHLAKSSLKIVSEVLGFELNLRHYYQRGWVVNMIEFDMGNNV